MHFAIDNTDAGARADAAGSARVRRSPIGDDFLAVREGGSVVVSIAISCACCYSPQVRFARPRVIYISRSTVPAIHAHAPLSAGDSLVERIHSCVLGIVTVVKATNGPFHCSENIRRAGVAVSDIETRSGCLR
jgi:hypothetical protein